MDAIDGPIESGRSTEAKNLNNRPLIIRYRNPINKEWFKGKISEGETDCPSKNSNENA